MVQGVIPKFMKPFKENENFSYFKKPNPDEILLGAESIRLLVQKQQTERFSWLTLYLKVYGGGVKSSVIRRR